MSIDDTIAADIERLMLFERATVYTDVGSPTGLFDQVVRTELPCRAAHVNVRPAQTTGARAELAAMRTLYWTRDYVMPTDRQLQVEVAGELAGQRWNLNADTAKARTGPGQTVVQRNADMTRAE